MRMRVWIEKVMLVRHLRSLDTSSLARRIYEEQKEKKWPGLVKETTDICQKLNIGNCNEEDIFKIGSKPYRKYLIQKCKEKDETELRKLAEGKPKCHKIMKDTYGKKDYMSTKVLSKVRQLFLSRVKMQHFAGNFPNDKRFEKTNWLCRCKTETESESHLLSGQCEVYGDLRRKYSNMEEDAQLADFFSAVLQRRALLDEEDRRTEDSLVAAQPLLAARHLGVPPVSL